MEKPQGFNVGKLAKRGVFSCFWGCNRCFRTIEEAQWHVDCSGVTSSNQTVQALYNASAAMKSDFAAVIGKPIAIDIKGILAGTQKRLDSVKQNEEFRKYLETFEEEDRIQFVETYLKNNIFKPSWYYPPKKSNTN